MCSIHPCVGQTSNELYLRVSVFGRWWISSTRPRDPEHLIHILKLVGRIAIPASARRKAWHKKQALAMAEVKSSLAFGPSSIYSHY